jgi:hypothetical protein
VTTLARQQRPRTSNPVGTVEVAAVRLLAVAVEVVAVVRRPASDVPSQEDVDKGQGRGDPRVVRHAKTQTGEIHELHPEHALIRHAQAGIGLVLDQDAGRADPDVMAVRAV